MPQIVGAFLLAAVLGLCKGPDKTGKLSKMHFFDEFKRKNGYF